CSSYRKQALPLRWVSFMSRLQRARIPNANAAGTIVTMWALTPITQRFAAAVLATYLEMARPVNTPRSSFSQRVRFGRWICLALAIIVIDQLSKRWFDTQLAYADRWQILPFFDFT